MNETTGYLPRPDGQRLAWRRVDGQGPTILWLGGFRADMGGTKAQALADWAARSSRSYLRFDYFGHGDSSGEFLDGAVSRWRDDALAMLDNLTEGKVVLVGSSMGGWLACLVAAARPARVRALVLTAPAPDFTDQLIAPMLDEAAQQALLATGVCTVRSAYDPDGYPITQALIEDGRRWSILPGPLAVDAPVRILQGDADEDVPWTHAVRLVRALSGDDVVFTLIKGGDHRLSRPQDIARLIATVRDACD